MSEGIRSISDADFEASVIEASKTKPVLVDFYADWCRPCHILAPTIEEITLDFAEKLTVVKLDTERNDSASRFGVSGIPTLILFVNGKEVDRMIGAVPREKIEEVLQRHLT